ncbi:MAG: Gx transporter family protein [Oscillospiraceae bacterium]|nr:Gx transporter family protein [Oscillospiraceae bacterium]
MNIKKLTYMAILTTLAIIIHVAESWIPLPIPIPGVKLGLSNIVIIFAMFSLAHPAEAVPILVIRILVGALITGNLIAFTYSLTGGIFAFIAMFLIKRYIAANQIWVLGIMGAIFHNIGQIAIAIVITGTPWIVSYLPTLIIAGILTGAITGLTAQLTLLRLRKNKSLDIC